MFARVYGSATRRQFVLAAIGATALPIIAACAPAATPTAVPAKPTAAPAPAVATAVPAKPTTAPAAATTAPAPAVATTAPAVATKPAPVAAAAPKPGAGPAIINVAMDADPVSFDGHVQTNFSSAQGSEHFYESLTAFDDKLNIVPSLAASWESAKDGLSYTFQLDPNAKFHDGTEFTADDVKWTTDRLLSPEIKSSWA